MQASDVRPIRVVIVAPYEPMRVGLAGVISAAEGMQVVGQCRDLAELAGSGNLRAADVFVVDSDALVGARRATYDALAEWLPRLRVLFLGTPDDARNLSPDDIPAYMTLDTVGFLLKDGPTSRIVDAIRLIAARTFVCETELIRHILTRLTQWARYSEEARDGHQLSEREVEVLQLVVAGASNKEIAQELFLSEGTVKAHVSHIMAKLQVERRTDLVRYALTHGLVSAGPDAAGGPGSRSQAAPSS
jgi:DNA-binding NarL/FixJ family response regulator